MQNNEVHIRLLSGQTGQHYTSDELEAIRKDYQEDINKREAFKEAIVTNELENMRKKIEKLKKINK